MRIGRPVVMQAVALRALTRLQGRRVSEREPVDATLRAPTGLLPSVTRRALELGIVHLAHRAPPAASEATYRSSSAAVILRARPTLTPASSPRWSRFHTVFSETSSSSAACL